MEEDFVNFIVCFELEMRMLSKSSPSSSSCAGLVSSNVPHTMTVFPRRMCESVGLEVVRLKRNAEGVVKLGMLKPGTYRELTKAEVNGLRAAAVKGRAQTRSAAQQSKAAERRPRGPVGKNAPRKQK